MPDDKQPILGDLYAQFNQIALVEGTSKAKCGCSVRKLQAYMGGNFPAGDLKPDQISAWQSWMRDQGLSVTTIRGYFGAVSMVYAWGVDTKKIQANPFKEAHKMRPECRPIQTMTTDEMTDLSDAAAVLESQDPSSRLRWVFMLEVAVGSGLRIGEIWNLRWDDIDLDKEVVRVRFRPDLEGQFWRWGSKGKTDRTVPIFQEAINAAYRLQQLAPWRYPCLPRKTCMRLQGQIGSLTENQRKSPYNNFYRQLDSIKAYANGKRAAEGKPKLTDGGMHMLRHTAVSQWFEDGLNVPEAQYLAGHRSEVTTLRIYTHVNQDKAVSSLREKRRH